MIAIEKKTKIVNPNAIPDEMKKIPQWVGWKGVPKTSKDGKPGMSKEPYALHGSYRQGFQHVYTFDEVVASYEKGNIDGIGFAMSKEVGFICIDLDGDSLDDIPDSLKAIANHSYAERSPSGNGLHIWFKGEWPGEKAKQGKENRYTKDGFKVECFYETGFLTMTGDVVNDLDIEESQDMINFIYDMTSKKAQKKSPKTAVGDQTYAELDDETVLATALKNMVTKKLFDGDTSNYDNDESNHDFALSKDFAKITKDPVQIARLMRRSKLERDKWDVHPTYLSVTIEKAIEAENSFSFDIIPQEEQTQDLIKSIRVGLEANPNTLKIVSNARNAETVLLSPIFKNVLGYDTFANMEVIKDDLPWRKRERPDKKYEPWSSSDDARLQHYMDKYFNISKSNVIQNAYTEVSRQNAFHPVKEYLEATGWDGTERVETLFIDFLGAQDTPYVRAVTRKWMAAAVNRIYEPGCKFDYMPVLVGEQGAKKSSTIAKLAGDWFSDSLKNFDSKEAGEQLQSSWIFEFGELAAMKKSEVEEVKAFITKRSDIYRLAYDRVVTEFQRKSVFIGTTNRFDFLRDQTGNRRFWPIEVDPANRKFDPATELTDQVVSQLWAEAVTLYKKGEKLYLNEELEAVARSIQNGHMEQDPRTGIILDYLEKGLPADWDDKEIWERKSYLHDPDSNIKREKVCAAEIWAECLGHDVSNMRAHDARLIYDILRNTPGWIERKPSRTRFKHYGTQTTFVREQTN